MLTKTVRRWVIGGSVALLAIAVIPVFAQQSPNADVLNALLVEVRGLRVAMEQMSSAGARVQLAMGRLQLQEQRINTLLRQLEGIRDRKVSTEREVSELRARWASLQEATEQTQAADDQRREAAAQSRELKRIADQRAIELQRLTTEEADVSNAIASEQSRWSDINRTLEELERALIGR